MIGKSFKRFWFAKLFILQIEFHWLYEKPAYDPKSFDLIIVDEAHKFRSNTADSYNELQEYVKRNKF